MRVTPGRRTALTLRILVHFAAIAPLIWLIFAIPQGVLGGDPVKELIHFLGIGAFRLLLFTLCVSPLAKLMHFGQLNTLRRPLGLWCFTWAVLHFYVWLAFDLTFSWSLIGEELVKRTYILVGFVALLLLTALAVTSIPRILRSMGRTWKTLHQSIYLIALLALLHYWWSLKSGWMSPAGYAMIIAILFYFRRNTIKKIFKRN